MVQIFVVVSLLDRLLLFTTDADLMLHAYCPLPAVSCPVRHKNGSANIYRLLRVACGLREAPGEEE